MVGVVGIQRGGSQRCAADLDGGFTLTAPKIDQAPILGAAASAAQLSAAGAG